MSLATKLIQVIWDKPKEPDVFKAHIWNWGVSGRWPRVRDEREEGIPGDIIQEL